MSEIESRLIQSQRRLARSTRKASTAETANTGYLAIARFLALPALRCFWPFTSVTESGSVIDMSGQGRTLTGAGALAFAVMGNGGAYAAFNGSTTYFYRADEAGLDITGQLTLLGWVYAAASKSQILAGKVNTGQTSYQVGTTSGNRFQMIVSSNGTALTSVTATTNYTPNTWYFLAGRYTPSTELALHWYAANSSSDGEKAINTTSIPASLHNGTAEFRIGANMTGSYLNGRASLVALLSYPLSDAHILELYEGTRALFMT